MPLPKKFVAISKFDQQCLALADSLIDYSPVLVRPEYEELHRDFEARIAKLDMAKTIEEMVPAQYRTGPRELGRGLLRSWWLLRYIGEQTLGKQQLIADIDARDVVALGIGFCGVREVECAVSDLHLARVIDSLDVDRGFETDVWRLVPWPGKKLMRKARSIVAKRKPCLKARKV